jgi:hypothetical protein
MRHAQAALTVLWVAMIPISLYMGWVKSVTFVSALSLWALVASHGAWWAAASVETKQAEEDVAGEVVQQMVDRTDVKGTVDDARSSVGPTPNGGHDEHSHVTG